VTHLLKLRTPVDILNYDVFIIALLSKVCKIKKEEIHLIDV
jgi:hypothetical protein